MKYLNILSVGLCFLLAGCITAGNDNSEEWIQLFNRKDLTGWDIKIAKHPLNEEFQQQFLC